MNKEKRLIEIDKRIQELERSRTTWLRTEGLNDPKTIKASSELRQLRLEKYDLENGTHELEIYMLEHEINRLTKLKENALLIKKEIVEKKIKRRKEKIKVYRRSNK